MNISLAELRRRLKRNPDLQLETPLEPPSGPRKAETVDGAIITLNTPQDGAETLYDYIRIHAPDIYPMIIREYKFDRWRIDLAIPSAMIAVECNGGRWLPGGGKHGKETDRLKIRRLTLAGWRVLEYSTEMLSNDPIGIIEEIREALGR